MLCNLWRIVSRMVKVGDKIRILGFATDSDGTLPISEKTLIGKVGTVTHIDDSFEIVEKAP